MHLYEILIRPVVTEKSQLGTTLGAYTFQVDVRANKQLVKEAVESIFTVNVVDVRLMRVPGKTRRFGRRSVKTPAWKKAVVKLAPGQQIDMLGKG
ncbi:MAG: 50S ribosomal protein L23 [Chloroflexi bacterium]|nr:50S ribosomal protein L23 [Chloroflexota bacterium]